MALPPTLVFALRYPALEMRWGRAGFGVAGLTLLAPCWEVAGSRGTKVLPHSEGATVGSATSERALGDTTSAVLARLRKTISAPAGCFPQSRWYFLQVGGKWKEMDYFQWFQVFLDTGII